VTRYEGTLETDTFIRFLEGKKGYVKRFESLVEKALKKGTVYFVPCMVVVEMVYLLERVYGLDRERVKEVVEAMGTLPVEIESKEVLFEALELYEAEAMSFGEALVKAVARLRDSEPVISFGRHK